MKTKPKRDPLCRIRSGFYCATRRDCYFSILREENENTSSLCSSLLFATLVQRQVDEWEGRTRGMSKKKIVESNCELEKGITRKFALRVLRISTHSFPLTNPWMERKSCCGIKYLTNYLTAIKSKLLQLYRIFSFMTKFIFLFYYFYLIRVPIVHNLISILIQILHGSFCCTSFVQYKKSLSFLIFNHFNNIFNNIFLILFF